jgi:hypothetical protein
MVPVDSFVCELVQRLRFFRSFDPLPADGRLLARHKGKPTLIKQLRPYLSDAAAAVGISPRIVPHQLRHTYATAMVRAGVSLPALMTLLGHVKAEMSMKYVQVSGEDLQREFLQAARGRGIWHHNRKRQRCRRVQAWMVLPTPYCSLNTPLKCSGDPCQTALPDAALIGFPTD